MWAWTVSPPLDGLAPKAAGAVVDASGDAYAEDVGGAAVLPAGLGLVVVDVLHDPDELSRLHEVEGDVAGGGLSLRRDAVGDVSEYGGLDHLGEDSVPVQLIPVQFEVVHVAVEGVFFVEGEDPSSRTPSTAASQAWVRRSFALGGSHSGLSDGSRQVVQVGFGVVDGEGCESRVQHEPVGCGLVELCDGVEVGGIGVQSQLVPEEPEAGLLVLGDDAVGHGVVYAEFPARLEGLV